MKLNLLTTATLLAVATTASAQSVTIYGIVDAAVEHVTNVGPTRSALTRLPGNAASAPSQIGFRGSEDLGGGLRAVFTLEQGFSPDSGALTMGGRAFGRQSFVGLAGPWGTLTLGRNQTMLFWGLQGIETMGPNMHGLSALDSYIPFARADKSVAYRGTFGSLTVGATYSVGRDTVNAASPAGTNCAGQNPTDKKACREWSALARYEASTWGAALAVDEFRGGPGAFAGLTNSSLKDTRVLADGYVKLGAAKLAAGLIRRNNDASLTTPRSDLWFLGASYPVTPQLVLDGQVFRLRFKNSANRATLAVARATYFLSKRTALYTTMGHIENDGTLAQSVSNGQAGGNPPAGAGQTGIAVGVRHTF